MAQLRTMVCGAVALAASAVLAPAALAVGERLMVDGCEVGGDGNDIHSVESRYDADRNEIVAALRLCNDVQSDATYRVHLDHAAPFVEEAEALASCKTPADSVVASTPGGHQGVGTSGVQGNLVSFVVPLDDLDVGEPEEVPLILLWATSSVGGTTARRTARPATAARIRRRAPRRWCSRGLRLETSPGSAVLWSTPASAGRMRRTWGLTIPLTSSPGSPLAQMMQGRGSPALTRPPDRSMT